MLLLQQTKTFTYAFVNPTAGFVVDTTERHSPAFTALQNVSIRKRDVLEQIYTGSAFAVLQPSLLSFLKVSAPASILPTPLAAKSNPPLMLESLLLDILIA